MQRENSLHPTVNMLWIGKQLGPIEQLSVMSFLEVGHPVHLYAYDRIDGVPSGTTIRNAEEVVPWKKMGKLRYKESGSYALGANYFRIVLQALRRGFWSDIDMVCIKPLSADADYVAGWEDELRINNALVYIDSEHPIMSDLSRLYDRFYIPPWIRLRRRRKLKLTVLAALGRPIQPELEWGAYGVQALTFFSKKHGVSPQPPSVFYPLHHSQGAELYNPNFDIESVISEDSRTIHLWNEVLRAKGLRGTRPPAGSPLGKMFANFGI
jgi:hypothetical protein